MEITLNQAMLSVRFYVPSSETIKVAIPERILVFGNAGDVNMESATINVAPQFAREHFPEPTPRKVTSAGGNLLEWFSLKR